MAVAYTEELLSRVTTWLSNSGSKRRTLGNLQELHQLYGQITGQPIGSCVSCGFSSYVGILEAYQTQATRFFSPQLMANAQYSLASGYENETFVHESHSKAVTAENLTDEDAEFFIKQGFRHAFLKDGKPLTDEAPVPAKKLTEKQQALADYKEVFGEDADDKQTAAELRKLIDARKAELSQQD